MIYRVRARFRTDTAAAFLEKLTDGTVQQQSPDGPEIVASMSRAVLNGAGEIEWSELCYCHSPLAHERATVLDAHFDDMSTEDCCCIPREADRWNSPAAISRRTRNCRFNEPSRVERSW